MLYKLFTNNLLFQKYIVTWSAVIFHFVSLQPTSTSFTQMLKDADMIVNISKKLTAFHTSSQRQAKLYLIYPETLSSLLTLSFLFSTEELKV